MQIRLGLFAATSLTATAAFCVVFSGAAVAQTAEQATPSSESATGPSLDEIVVTARKRSERQIDVPAAISVVDAADLSRYATADLSSVDQIPQVLLTKNPSGNGANLNIRGVGSNTSADDGIEQAVSVNIDGVPTSRGRIMETGLFDIGDVQVLKGPQALYFGKNSPGGVVVVDSQGPTAELQGYAKAGYEIAAQDYIGEAAVGGPITDTLGFRIAVRANDMKGGYVHDVAEPISAADNPVAYDHAEGYAIPGRAFSWGPQDQTVALRTTLKWVPSDTFDSTFKFFVSDYKDNGDGSTNVITSCVPGQTLPTTTDLSAILFTGAPAAPADPNGSCGNRRWTNTLGQLPAVFLNGFAFNKGNGNFTDNKTYISSLVLDYRLDRITFTSVSGFYKYSNIGNSFFDDNSLSLAGGGANSFSTSWNQEFRAVSSFDFPVNFSTGIFYSHDVREYANWSDIVRFVDPTTGISVSSAGDALNVGHTVSPFLEVNWKILPNVELAAGARYSSERKTGTLANNYVQPGLAQALDLALPVGDTLRGQVRNSNVSPQATLTWHPDGDSSVYVGYRTGFLAGTITNPGLISAALNNQNIVIQPETVKGYEAGYKFEALNRRLLGDFAIYHYAYDNLQVSAFDSVSNTVLTKNAGGSLVKGIEGNLKYRLTEEISLRAAAGYNHARYTAFPNAACWGGQTVAQGCTNNEQNLTGQPLPRAPLWSETLGASWDTSVTGGLKLGLTADARASSAYNYVATNNPYAIQQGYYVLDTSVRLYDPKERWEAAAIIQNVTDRYYYSIGSERPLGTSPGSIDAVPGNPRTVLLQGTYKF